MQTFSFFDASKVGSSVIYLDIGETLLDKGVKETLTTILDYVEAHKPAIVAVDGFKAIHDMIRDPVEERRFGYELAVRLATWGVTAFLVGAYSQQEIEEAAIFGIADVIVRLHNQLQAEHYQRYVDVIKMRGENYFRGLHPFTISADGLSVYPASEPRRSSPPMLRPPTAFRPDCHNWTRCWRGDSRPARPRWSREAPVRGRRYSDCISSSRAPVAASRASS